MQATILIMTNVPDIATARALAQQLITNRLAACVNLLPGMESIYQWQGEVKEGTEVTLLIKSVQSRYVEIEAAIRTAHPYQLPEIIALPIVAGLPEYLDWIAKETIKVDDGGGLL